MSGNNAGAAKRPDNNNAIKDAQPRIRDTAYPNMQTARQSLAVVSPKRPCGTSEMLFRRRRQRDRLVRQCGEIGNHVGALAVLADAGKTHRGAGNKGLRVGEEFVEVVK